MSKPLQPTATGQLPLVQHSNPSNGLPFTNTDECRARNDRQSYFALALELAQAQFQLADQELSSRLWDEVQLRQMDPERIINLLYGCCFQDDHEAMVNADQHFLQASLS
ncbi:MAG: hypothetical protein VKJ87_06295 [Synechococcus sp.]|nr:hypothetical protein [Synechococcus sp.]